MDDLVRQRRGRHLRRLLGLTPGRTGACVQGWLAEQTPAFRAGIAVVVIDPSAPYASGIRAALPDALIAVDHFHLVQLANQMVTDVRQRVAREQLVAAVGPLTAHGRTGGCCSPPATGCREAAGPTRPGPGRR